MAISGRSDQAEAQLILISAGTAARRELLSSRAQRLIADLDWPALTDTLRLRRLLPVLGPRILALAGARVDPAFPVSVEQALELGARQGTFLQLISMRLAAMLAESGIRAAVLKGPLLGEAIHGHPGRRLSSDIDLLVAPEQLHAAVSVVRGLGYGAPTDYLGERGLPMLHCALIHERGELPPVELHWRIHWYERDFARDRLLPPSVDPAGLWRPAPADELAALLLFYARDGFIDLRLASDLSAWWDLHGEELAPDALEQLLRAYPALARALAVAAEVAGRTVGVPASRLLGVAPRPGLRERLAARLADPNPRASQAQLHADMGLIDGLLAPPGGFGAFVRRQILPPREVLDQQARHGARRRARSRAGRGVGVLVRYGLAMARLVHAPETAR